MKTMILALSLFLSVSASANSCLQQVSNSDLVNELSTRLGARPAIINPNLEVNLGVTCDAYGFLKLSTTDLMTGESNSGTINLSSRSSCLRIVEVLTAKRGRAGALIAATCDAYGTMIKVVVIGSKFSTSSENIGTRAQCLELAEGLNR